MLPHDVGSITGYARQSQLVPPRCILHEHRALDVKLIDDISLVRMHVRSSPLPTYSRFVMSPRNALYDAAAAEPKSAAAAAAPAAAAGSRGPAAASAAAPAASAGHAGPASKPEPKPRKVKMAEVPKFGPFNAICRNLAFTLPLDDCE